MSKLIFRQLFDSTSSTYTYILGCGVTRLAAIIDPVYEKVARDTQLLKDLDLKLKYALNTHCHADHVTGTAALRSNTQCQTVISKASGASADRYLVDNEIVEIGELQLEARSTPGHTDGCMTFVLHQHQLAFTGDTLMVRACGRTDFQQGSASTLYKSVHERIFTLPDNFTVHPAHDYKGFTCTTVREEKLLNPRLTRPYQEFVDLMDNLGLSFPKKLDVSVPWNMKCGPIEADDDKILADIRDNKPPE